MVLLPPEQKASVLKGFTWVKFTYRNTRTLHNRPAIMGLKQTLTPMLYFVVNYGMVSNLQNKISIFKFSLWIFICLWLFFEIE